MMVKKIILVIRYLWMHVAVIHKLLADKLSLAVHFGQLFSTKNNSSLVVLPVSFSVSSRLER